MGAVGEGGVHVLNTSILRDACLSETDVDRAATRWRAELDLRVSRLRAGSPGVPGMVVRSRRGIPRLHPGLSRRRAGRVGRGVRDGETSEAGALGFPVSGKA